MLYCVVAREAPRKVAEALTRHVKNDPTVSVLIDQRDADRRSMADRRVSGIRGVRIEERRKVRHPAGRRVADRRAVFGPPFRELGLPRAAHGHAQHITIGTRVPHSPDLEDDVIGARLALAHQAGDMRAFEGIYELWFDRVYTFFRTVHSQTEDVEQTVNSALTSAFERLGTFVPSLGAFRTWLGGVVADVAAAASAPEDPELADPRILDRWVGPADLDALTWLSDDELIVLIRQLPPTQREVVGLQYVFGLSVEQLRHALMISEAEVNELHDRGLRFMSGCLTSLSRRPGFSGRLPMVERRRYYPVTSRRKKALVA